MKQTSSLARIALIRIAAGVLVLTIASTAIIFLVVRDGYEEIQLGNLSTYMTERIRRESLIYKNIRVLQAQARDALVERLEGMNTRNLEEEFDFLFPVQPDGSRRSRTQLFDGSFIKDGNYVYGLGAFMSNARTLTSEDKKKLLVAFHLVHSYGEASLHSLSNFYFFTPDNHLVIFAPNRPDKLFFYRRDAPADLDFSEEDFNQITLPENNPERMTRCTTLKPIYYDRTNRTWTTGCQTPVDMNGVHIGSFGTSILLSDLFSNAIEDHIDGAENMIITPDGHLIAHATLTRYGEETARYLNIMESGNLRLMNTWAALQTADSSRNVQIIKDHANDQILAVGRIEGPGWYFITAYPRQLIGNQALDAALYVAKFAVIAGVLVLAILFLVMKRGIADPLQNFVRHVNQIASGRFPKSPEQSTHQLIERRDEIGLLARSIHSMAGKLARLVRGLEGIVKRRTAELEDHRNHLEKQVLERTLQLTEAQQRAEAANLAKSVFLTNMSHEIRTPMNAIIGLTHLLQRAGPKPDQVERLDKIDTAAEHLLSIINDILDLSRIEAGKLDLEYSIFDLDMIFSHVESLLKERADLKGLTITAERTDMPTWLKGDLTRLRQALLNYAANAVKFTEQGKIFLRAKIIKEQDDKILVRFEVQDNGIGIKPDQVSSLFDAFEQADASQTREHGGSGLGLAITKHLACQMGGGVGVETKSGEGSTFWFTAWLGCGHPVEQVTPGTLEEDAESILRADYADARILLVEDNAINREVAQELLTSAGLAVDMAENGKVAVAMVRDTSYDLVLMDVQMPQMDGLEATRKIRSMEDRQHIVILAMTANVFAEDRRDCREAGMNDFVAKPVRPQNLFMTVLKWLSKDGLVDPVESEFVEARSESVDGPYTSGMSRENGGNPIDPGALALIFGDNPEQIATMLRKFATEMEINIVELETAFRDRDAEQVNFHAHKLKSSAGTVGAHQLSDLCLALEQAGRKGDWPVIESHFPGLRPIVKQVKDYIDEL